MVHAMPIITTMIAAIGNNGNMVSALPLLLVRAMKNNMYLSEKERET